MIRTVFLSCVLAILNMFEFSQNQSQPPASAQSTTARNAAHAPASEQSSDRSWIATSNGYANMLIAVSLKHHPEYGSQQGLAQYDTKISQPTLA